MPKSLYPKRQSKVDKIALVNFLVMMFLYLIGFIIASNICKPSSIYLLI